MKKVAFILAFVAAFLISGMQPSFAQKKEKKNIDVTGVKIEKSKGANPNITTPKPTTDVVAPKMKGPKYGASLCDVAIENYTGYIVDIYVDGEYRGTIGAYETGVTWAIPGRTRLYGISIGGTVEWGPSYVDCNWLYTWRLYVAN